jgi:hypothetical protein
MGFIAYLIQTLADSRFVRKTETEFDYLTRKHNEAKPAATKRSLRSWFSRAE